MNKDVRVFAGPHDQLGSPGQIADTAEQEFQSRRFAARRPWLTFGLLPVLAFPFLAAAVFVGPGWLIARSIELFGLDERLTEVKYLDWVPLAAKSYAAGAIIVAAGLIVWQMSRLARRSGLSARWPLTSAVLVALVAGCIWSDATPKTPGRQGTLMLGLGYPMRAWTVFQIVQLAAPLSFAAWLTRPRAMLETTPIEMARAA